MFRKRIMVLIILSFFNGDYLSAQHTYKLFYGVNYIDSHTFFPIHGSYYLEGIQANELMYSRLWTWTKDLSETSDLVENITSKSFTTMRVPTYKEPPWSYKIQIQEKLKWPDGEPLTAEDIAFSFNVFKHEKSGSVLKDKLKIFKEIKVIDNRTVQFFIEEKDKINAKYLLPLVQILPKHKFTEDYLPKEESKFTEDPMGSGPFQFNWKNSEDEKYSFTKNNYYYKWGNNSNINAVNIYEESDIKGLITKLTTSPRTEDWNTLDLLLELPNSGANYNEIESRSAGNLSFKSYKSNSWYGIAFNCENPLLENPEIRLALTYALNIEQLLKHYAKIDIGSKKENITRRISGPFNQQFGVGDDIKYPPRKFNSDKSRDLLNKNNVIEKKGKRYYNGKPLQSLMLIYDQGSFPKGSVEEVIIENLKYQYENIDITLKISSLLRDDFENRLISGNYDMAFQYYEMGFSSNIEPLFTEGNSQNISRFYDPLLTSYMTRFNNTNSTKQQKMYGDKIHKLVYDKAPYIFLYRLEKIMGYRKELVHGNNIVPKYFFTHINEWYFKDF
ncbi:MAG: ABC transporter substrate-binding protein [Candidatus Marinimicrobia bacterium]|nr:ABC transporter substrate-binding protein [Candidatus Neomarinimicrobiota bacterium]MBL7109344.1 ABC transporter substrate-binding protein [Candidatus Neomarinimicrobiota bacterium]